MWGHQVDADGREILSDSANLHCNVLTSTAVSTQSMSSLALSATRRFEGRDSPKIKVSRFLKWTLDGFALLSDSSVQTQPTTASDALSTGSRSTLVNADYIFEKEFLPIIRIPGF